MSEITQHGRKTMRRWLKRNQHKIADNPDKKALQKRAKKLAQLLETSDGQH